MGSVLIHPQAVVDDDCKIGTGTKVWQFASVIRKARLGRDCSVGAGALIDNAVVGDGCAIGAGAQLHPGTKLGNDVFFGPGAKVANDVWPTVDKDGWRFPGAGEYFVVIEDGASIGMNATLLPGAFIRTGALVAAGAVCSRMVPPGGVCQRNGYVSAQRPSDWRERRMRFVC